jgi:methionyl-tRNA formyltransferase
MKIIFFGGRHVRDFIFPLKDNFDLSLIVTTDQAMADEAASEKTPYTKVLEINDRLINEIQKLEPDLGIVADFGIILPKKLLDIFPYGVINVHPSLLPKYRGATPVQTAILNGEIKTGITIIKVDEKMDHGPIIYQEEFDIKPGEFTQRFLPYLFSKAAEILPEVISQYAENDYELMEQDHHNATYTKILKRDDGYVDAENPPDHDTIIRMINALSPWPGVWTKYKLTDKEVIIKFHPNGVIHVEGKKPMLFKDFINGYEKGAELLKKLNLS